MKYKILSATASLTWAILLAVSPSNVLAQPEPVCSSESSCVCPSGVLQCGAGGGGGSPCQPNETAFCHTGPQRVCRGQNGQIRTELTCFLTGTPPGGTECQYVANMDIVSTGNNLSFDYINNLGNLPGCLHANVGGCIFLASQVTLPNPMPWNYQLGRFETADEYRGHYARDCMVGQLPANPPAPGLSTSQYPTYGFNLGSQGINGSSYAGAGYPYLVFNANCEFQGVAQNYNQVADACGGIDVFTRSPISLVFDDSYDFENNVAIVSFPVEPNSDAKLYSWKASSKTPLLVYDPEHKGNITSAQQLFGNWTFGGQRVASLFGNSTNTAWRNGFEALATLDSNGDKKVSGDELRNLALWFDANQNGVSEDGEVQSLDAHGVRELYYVTDLTDPETKSIYATQGFLRMVDGREVIGKAVDWYSTANGGVDQFLKNFAPQSFVKQSLNNVVTSEESQYLAQNKSQSISGRWQWQATNTADSAKSIRPRGMFYIEESEPGHFIIASANYIKPATTGAPKLVGAGFEVMVGKIGQDGSTLSFASQSDSTYAYKSHGILQPDGKTIEGETVATGRVLSGKTGSLKYQWTATRVD